ncbi:MAG: hypothetical protein Q9220_000623 [cf. Caloplaca sp. 1 TL-2023]
MVKKDKKSKTAEQKARVAAKQEKKAAQKDKKGKSKGTADSDADDVDLEAIREEYEQQIANHSNTGGHHQQAQFLKITESPCDPPSARSSATLIGSPSNSGELLLFGGEYYNGALASFYNDLFVYLIEKDQWRKVTSPNSPLPRSGHAWTRSLAGDIYLFGGEFSSPKQGTFYHYNDFWKLNPSTREWTRIESKKGPPARSGHRMTYFKQYVVLFGGFQDTSQATKYLQDLWIYDTHSYTWFNPVLPPATQKPDPRSSFSFHPHEAGAVLYGGYSRVKSTAGATGKQPKSGGGGQGGARSVLKPVIHQDTWFLRIITPPAETPPSTPPSVRWERRKKPVNSPNPTRAGATQAYHKGRGIVFGGVHDVEESEEGMDSEFFDTLLAWNIERNRFFQLTLRRPRAAAAAAAAKRSAIDDRGNKKGRGKLDEEELLRNLAALEAKSVSADVAAENPKPMDLDGSIGHQMEDHPPTSAALSKPKQFTMPHPRFNTQLAVQDDILYIFGGTYESGDREFTFDEMWSINLGKLDGVTEIYKRELENWQGSDDDGSSGDDDDNDEEVSEDEDMEAGVPLPVAGDRSAGSSAGVRPASPPSKMEVDEPEAPVEAPVADTRPHPRPFENLRDFFARTSIAWQDFILESVRSGGGDVSSAGHSVKELRKIAFERAETMWWDCREEITALEDEQEEAGIGEVVSIADRGQTGGEGPGRRR